MRNGLLFVVAVMWFVVGVNVAVESHQYSRSETYRYDRIAAEQPLDFIQRMLLGRAAPALLVGGSLLALSSMRAVDDHH